MFVTPEDIEIKLKRRQLFFQTKNLKLTNELEQRVILSLIFDIIFDKGGGGQGQVVG